MSDPYRNPYTSSGDPYSDISRLSYGIRNVRGGVTQSQRELYPFVQQARSQQEEEGQRLRPLQLLFDILQRGQYMTANMAQEIVDSIKEGKPLGPALADMAKGAWEGITGKTKGDWTDVLFPGIKDDERGAIGAAFAGDLDVAGKKALGFLANVAFDPLSWFSFGSTGAARVAGREFAERATSQTLRNFGEEGLQRLGMQGKDVGEEGIAKLMQRMSAQDPAKKLIEQTYNRFQRQGTRGRFTDLPAGMAEAEAKRLGEGLGTAELGRFGGRQQLVREPGQNVAAIMQELYPRAGESAGRFAGIEFGRGQDNIFGAPGKAWDFLSTAFGNIPVPFRKGVRFSDAWWAVMNKGPVGMLRKTFGFFKSPYEQMLNTKKRNAELGTHQAQKEAMQKAGQIVGVLSDEERPLILQAMLQAQQEGITASQALMRGAFDPEVAPKLAAAAESMDNLFTEWLQKENASADVLKEYVGRFNYLPHYPDDKVFLKRKAGQAKGTYAARFTKEQTRSLEQHVQTGINTMKLVFPPDMIEAAAAKKGTTVDKWLQDFVLTHGGAEIELDLEKVLMLRAMEHGKAMGRVKIIEDFRQFGIPVEQLPDVNVKQWGLEKIGDDPALGDMAFDSEVTKILTRINQTLDSDEGYAQFVGLWRKNMQWWKSVVTTYPGFHLRNFTSNEWTGFMKHGVRWFDADITATATAGISYALSPAKFTDFIKQEMKLPDSWTARKLSEPWLPGISRMEAVEEAMQRGVVSSRTMGFDTGDSLKEMAGNWRSGGTWKPWSTQNIAFKASHRAGEYVENYARLKSFLLDLKDIAAKRPAEVRPAVGVSDIERHLTDVALHKDSWFDYAASEARKWFIDYGDMTPAEQKWMKNIIPFYGWLRKNLGNQLSGLLLHGDMYVTTAKALSAIQNDDFDYELLEDWQERLGMIPVGQTREGKWVLFTPDLPFQDINMLPVQFAPGQLIPEWQGLLDEVGSAVHPVVKTIMELLSNKDLFRKRDIKDFEVAPSVLQFFAESPQVLGFLDGAMRMAGAQNGVRVNANNGVVQMDGRVQRIIQNNLPVLQVVRLALENKEEMATLWDSGLDGWLDEMVLQDDDLLKLQSLFKGISRVFGVSLRELSEQQRQAAIREEALRQAETERREYRTNLPGYEQRSGDYWRQRDQTARRLYGP